MQFGFINYADSIDGGIPIGFLSIVRNGGYYALEYSFSEYYPVTFGFKIGLEKFYTTIFAAFSPIQEKTARKFAYGLGFGSILPITGSFFFSPELITMSQMGFSNNTLFSSFVPYFGYNINRNFSVTAAPTFTWAYNDEGEDTLKSLFSILNREINDKHGISLGVRAALRYRF
jgi:hypothetical protein